MNKNKISFKCHVFNEKNYISLNKVKTSSFIWNFEKKHIYYGIELTHVVQT